MEEAVAIGLPRSKNWKREAKDGDEWRRKLNESIALILHLDNFHVHNCFKPQISLIILYPKIKYATTNFISNVQLEQI